MPETLTAEFTSRRDADTAVEHIVQEHGIDRNDIRIASASDANSAGTEVAAADIEHGREKTDTEGEPALAGKIAVSVTVDKARAGTVLTSFETFGGTESTK